MFESIKLLIQYCHANGIREVAMNLSPPILRNLDFRNVLDILRFLTLNTELTITVFSQLIKKVTDREHASL